jgi:hypothetical protein
MVLRSVDVEYFHAVGVAQGAQGPHVGEVVEEVEAAVEAEAVERFESAIARRGGEVCRGIRRGRGAEKSRVDPANAELEAQVERGLGRPGPLPVAEEMEDAHPVRIRGREDGHKTGRKTE